MLFACPQAGVTPLLRCVICFQFPMGPAKISGAAENERRTAAEILPSSETDTEGPHVPVETRSSARYSESIFDVGGSSKMTEESPCAYSPALSFPCSFPVRLLAGALRS